MSLFKVLLIDPQYGIVKLDQFVPLGLSYIASVLLEEGIKVDGYNLSVDRFREDSFKDYDIVGIYSSVVDFDEACTVAETAKRVNPDIFIVMGGPLPSILPEEVLKIDSIDCVCIGEGEFTMRDLALALRDGRDISEVKGIMFKQNGNVVKTPSREVLRDLDKIPFPARHIFDHGNYNSNPYCSIIASRGCPYQCTNCKPALDYISSYRRRSPIKVVDELEYLINQYKVKRFIFLDSELVGPKKWTLNFCNEVKKRRLKFTFYCNARISDVDEEVLENLKQVGCNYIAYGIESGSQRVIDEILNKKMALGRVIPVLKATVKRGIDVHAWFMLGIPGETWNEVTQTIDFAAKVPATVQERHVALPWPGTYFYEIAKENGWLISDNFREYCDKKYRGYASVIKTPYLSIEQIKLALKLFDRNLIRRGWVPRRWIFADNDAQFWSVSYLFKHLTYKRQMPLGYLLNCFRKKILKF